ncbi:MAG: TIR domain-containing protein [Schaedlerella sp.]|nr:TIR domain-containing protein [Schaedlerella sp.]
MRNYLEKGTWIRLPGGECYEITDTPVGETNGCLIYPAIRLLHLPDGSYKPREMKFAVKECFPVSSEYTFLRSENGEIIPESDNEESWSYLTSAWQMQMNEVYTISNIYKSELHQSSILNGAARVELSLDKGQTFHYVNNTITISESLSPKGNALRTYLKDMQHISPSLALRIIQQLLHRVKEIHDAGYLHLDIQDKNIFIKGSLSDSDDFTSIIDFISARQRAENGKCDVIKDKVLFGTSGYTAPEILNKNDGTLQLGPEADLYSIGYLLLFLLTGKYYSVSELYFKTNDEDLMTLTLPALSSKEESDQKLQTILCKSLEYAPEIRYHSCDEMLADISDFLETVPNCRNELPSISCDAFICYRHNTKEGLVARALQEQLEHLHVPRFLEENVQNFEHIFLDVGELASCSDLGLQIHETIKNSSWLILICSLETKDSLWINQEIKTFLKYHDHSRILALITEGEAENVLPDALRRHNNDTLNIHTIDIREQTLEDVIKNLKGDTLLKIAAPIWGTTYDSLQQRKRTQTFQRTAYAAGIAFALLSGFTAYLLFQNQKLNEKYEFAMENQARYLSDISHDLYLAGDKNTALLTALAVTPDTDNGTSVVPEQMYALNTALEPYKSDIYSDYSTIYTSEISSIVKCSSSPEGSYILTLDQEGNVHFLAGDTGKSLWTVDSKSVNADSFRSIMPISESSACLMTSNTICMADLNTKEIKILLPTEYSLPQKDSGYAVCNNLLAVNDHNYIYIYDLSGATLLHTINLEGRLPDKTQSTNVMAFQNSGNSLAIGLSENILIYSLEKETLSEFIKTGASALMFIDETHLAAIHYTAPDSEADINNLWNGGSFSYHLAVYSTKEDTAKASSEKSSDNEKEAEKPKIKNPVYKSSEFELSSPLHTGLTLNKDNNQIFCWFENNLLIIDSASLKSEKRVSFNENINGVYNYDNSQYLVGLDNGKIQLLTVDDEISQQEIFSLNDTVNKFFYHQNLDSIIQLHSQILTYSSTSGNSDMKLLYVEDIINSDYFFKDITYETGVSTNYRCIELSHNAGYNTTALAVYDANTDEEIYKYEADPSSSLLNISFGQDAENSYLCFTVHTASGETTFCKINLTTRKVLIQENVTKYNTAYFFHDENIAYSRDMNKILVKEALGTSIFDISKSTIKKEGTLLEDVSISKMLYSQDNKYIIIQGTTSSSQICIYIYNTETESFTESTIICDSDSPVLRVGYTQSIFAVHDKDSQIDIYDCLTGSLIRSIALNSTDYGDFIFFNEDNSLITQTDSSFTVWDITNGNILTQYSSDQSLPLGTLSAEAGSSYFTLKDFSADSQSEDTMFMFYADDNQQIYPFAEIAHGYADLASMQVYHYSGIDLTYTDIYNYAELADMAEEFLNGKTLSDADKQKYHISK